MQGLILSIIFYNIILFIIYSKYKKGYTYISGKSMFFYMLLFIAYGTYGTHVGDYLRVNEMVEYIGQSPDYIIAGNFEPQYSMLAKFVHGNYVLWRLIINSIAFIGLGYFLHKSNLNDYRTLLLFTALSLFLVACNRGQWGQIYFFFGLYLCYYRKWSYLLLTIAAYFSHASLLVLFALIPISFLKINKYLAVLFLGVVVLSLGYFQDSFDALVSTGIDNEYYNAKLNSYTNQNTNNFFGASIGETIQSLLSFAPKYVFYFYLSYLLFKNRYNDDQDKARNAIMIVSLILFWSSIVCNFLDLGTGTIARRLFEMTSIPMLILVRYVFVDEKEKYYDKLIKWEILAMEVQFAFFIYYAYANPHFLD